MRISVHKALVMVILGVACSRSDRSLEQSWESRMKWPVGSKFGIPVATNASDYNGDGASEVLVAGFNTATRGSQYWVGMADGNSGRVRWEWNAFDWHSRKAPRATIISSSLKDFVLVQNRDTFGARAAPELCVLDAETGNVIANGSPICFPPSGPLLRLEPTGQGVFWADGAPLAPVLIFNATQTDGRTGCTLALLNLTNLEVHNWVLLDSPGYEVQSAVFSRIKAQSTVETMLASVLMKDAVGDVRVRVLEFCLQFPLQDMQSSEVLAVVSGHDVDAGGVLQSFMTMGGDLVPRVVYNCGDRILEVSRTAGWGLRALPSEYGSVAPFVDCDSDGIVDFVGTRASPGLDGTYMAVLSGATGLPMEWWQSASRFARFSSQQIGDPIAPRILCSGDTGVYSLMWPRPVSR